MSSAKGVLMLHQLSCDGHVKIFRLKHILGNSNLTTGRTFFMGCVLSY